MRADPKPVEMAIMFPRQGSPATGDAYGPIVALPLEPQRRMTRVIFPEFVRLTSFRLDSVWHSLKCAPELGVVEDVIERFDVFRFNVF